MGILETYYTYARLAQAAYIDLSSEATPNAARTIVNAGRDQQRLPERLGEQLFGAGDYSGSSEAWTLLDPYYRTGTDSGHSDPASGYAGMLLSNPQYGKVLAIAGTEPTSWNQFHADLLSSDVSQIGFLGGALRQVVSLFNHVQELRGAAGATNVLRLEVRERSFLPPLDGTPFITQVVPGFPPTLKCYWLEAHNDGRGRGLLAAGETLTVTGHSLGGHVAAMAVALFPDLFTTAYTFNAPGYNPPSSALSQPLGADGLLNLFTRYGASPVSVASIVGRVVTIESEDAVPGDDADGITGNITGTPFSPETYVTTEQVTHDIGHLTEGLALQALIARLNPALTVAQMGRILETATANTSSTYELLVEKLAHAILGERIELRRTGPANPIDGGDFTIRTEYFAQLLRLEDAVRTASGLQLIPLTALPAADLQTAASNPDALAYRYALKELNPFAVLGVDYGGFNRNGELNLFDPATGEGMLTASWLEDRAKMLAWLMAGNTNDRGYDLTTGGINWQFQDLGSRQAAYALSTASAIDGGQKAGADPSRLAALFQAELARGTASRVAFGSDDPEILSGGKHTDRLYGAGGNDVLAGGEGADWLEGGDGHDTLIGGTGNDIYHVGVGQGTDTVVDAAESGGRQQGEIRFGEAALAGTFTALDPDLKTFTFAAADGQYYASYSGSVQANLAGRLTLWRGDSGARIVQLENFRSGDFGIVLGTEAPPRQYADIAGTEEADHSGLGNTLTHQDTLRTNASVQRVYGNGGADWIVLAHADTEGWGGLGNDYIVDVGGEGAQRLKGEAGGDCLVAGAGGDELYGGADGDALQGGAGADLVDGGAGDDFLDGGVGVDAISGGEGRDFILGGGNLTYSLKRSDEFYSFAMGTYGGLSFDGNRVSLPPLVGIDPSTTDWSNYGYGVVEGDEGDAIDAGAGEDTAYGGLGEDAILGGENADHLVGGSEGDYVEGGEGQDTILGDGLEGDMSQESGMLWFHPDPETHGRDVLAGGAGDDYVRGDGGADLLFGDEGDDVLAGDADHGELDVRHHGDDQLDGGAGNDRLYGQGGNDALSGGEGNDTLMGDDASLPAANHGADTLDGGAGGADVLYGGAGSDHLGGLYGDDLLYGEDGDDTLGGGTGIRCGIGDAHAEATFSLSDKSQSARYGEGAAANDRMWRRKA